MSPTYTISELAKEFGITTRTIRFYEDKGLISPERNGQKRVFSARDKTRLKLILRGKRVGLSLDESHEIIDMYDHESGNKAQLERLLLVINNQRDNLKEKRNDLDAMEAALAQVEEKCLKALKTIKKP